MNARKIYRDSLEESVVGPIKISHTLEGHTVEQYKLENGQQRFFVTLAGTHWCAHGDSIASAIADANWKDPSKRPTAEALVKTIQTDGHDRKITLNEFRVVTGACLVGCKDALEKVGRDEAPLTAFEIRNFVSKEWGDKLLSILEWKS